MRFLRYLTMHVTALNRLVAVKLTAMVGTMACAYFFVFLAILGFPGGHASAQAYVQWISQTFIQLVMLSVIMVGQKIISDQQASHARAQETQQRSIDDLHAQHAELHRKIDNMR
jgi:hypothetical protein